MNNDEKNENNSKSPENSKINKSPELSSPNNTKKEKKKRIRKKKNEKNTKSKNYLSPESNNFSSDILSEIKQISIPTILSEKENLFKILQSEIITIDKSLSLLNKKKKYYNEIIQKLIGEIQNEKKNVKKNEIKNKEYLYMENILKDYDINDTFENYEFSNNSYYNINKIINTNLDSNFYSLNQNNNNNYLIINFFDEKNNTINNKMEPNYQLSYEEFNTISDLEDNFCLLLSKEKNKINEYNNNSFNKNKDELKNNINNSELNIIDDNKINIEDNKINIENNKINIEDNKINIEDNKINIEDNKIYIEDNKINKEREENKYNYINGILKDMPNSPYTNAIQVENEDFEIIAEAPAEQEETTIKNRKKLSVENKNIYNINDNNMNKIKEIDIDKSINKNYSNNLEELDFYSLKDNKIKDIKENKKKKITFEDIQKKYKTQDMGSDFIKKDISSNEDKDNPSDDENNNFIKEKEKQKIKKRKQKKKKNTNIKDNDLDINKSESIQNENENETEEDNINIYNSDISKPENDFSDNSEISKSNDDINKNKKKRGRKKKKESKIVFSFQEELPDPEILDSVGLALEMKKYGMKPQNKKRNIEILKSVYKFLKIKELPENISKKLASFDLDNDENNIDSENENKIRNKKKEDNSNITELSDEQKKNIIDIIKDNKTIYERILLFKEISIKEIKALLVSKGIIIQNHLLSKFLIDSGVILPGGWNNKK